MTQSIRKSAKKPRAAAHRKSGPAVAALHMLSDAEMRRIAEKIFKFSDADETEVEIGVVSDALTRFANNTIHQNVAEQVLTVSVRTVLDGQTARATTNKTDDESLRRAVAASKRWRAASRAFPACFRCPDRRNTARSRATLKTRRMPRPPIARAPSPAWRKWPKKTSRRRPEFSRRASRNRLSSIRTACSHRIARRAPNFPSPFSNPIPPAGPRPIRPTSAASIPRRWPAAPAKNPPLRASRAKPRPASGP